MDFISLNLPSSFLNWFTSITTSYVLILAAEIGDKSQLVCMSMAARHRAWPVIFGAVCAFAVLNTLAVVFGVAIAKWMPQYLLAAIVCLLFAVFGLHALLINENEAEEDEQPRKISGHNLFFTTFLLITLAELGDKTQLAVVALSSTALPVAIWIGSTLALATTSILGVIAGRTVLNKIPLILLHRLSGLIFIILAGISGYQAYSHFSTNFDSTVQFLATVQ